MKSFVKFLYLLIQQKEKLNIDILKENIDKFDGEIKLLAIYISDLFLVSNNLIEDNELLEIFYFKTQNGGNELEILRNKTKTNSKFFILADSVLHNTPQPNVFLSNVVISENLTFWYSSIILFFLVFLFFCLIKFSIMGLGLYLLHQKAGKIISFLRN